MSTETIDPRPALDLVTETIMGVSGPTVAACLRLKASLDVLGMALDERDRLLAQKAEISEKLLAQTGKIGRDMVAMGDAITKAIPPSKRKGTPHA